MAIYRRTERGMTLSVLPLKSKESRQKTSSSKTTRGTVTNMAKYLYQCYVCGEKLEQELPISEYKPDEQPICPKCGRERMHRVIENATFLVAGGRKKGKH